MTEHPTASRGLLAAFVLALVAAAAAKAAAPRAATADSCGAPPASVQPFTAWGDSSSYVLTSGGSFEGGPAWALSGGAAVVDGNAPDPLAGPGDSHSLSLPAGSSATSVCVRAPHIKGLLRFFAKRVGSGDGRLDVQIIANRAVYESGLISAGSDWAPTDVLTSDAPDTNGATAYQVRLTAVGGAFDVDGVYFDPYSSR